MKSICSVRQLKRKTLSKGQPIHLKMLGRYLGIPTSIKTFHERACLNQSQSRNMSSRSKIWQCHDWVSINRLSRCRLWPAKVWIDQVPIRSWLKNKSLRIVTCLRSRVSMNNMDSPIIRRRKNRFWRWPLMKNRTVIRIWLPNRAPRLSSTSRTSRVCMTTSMCVAPWNSPIRSASRQTKVKRPWTNIPGLKTIQWTGKVLI